MHLWKHGHLQRRGTGKLRLSKYIWINYLLVFVLIPYRILCNDAQREGAKLTPELPSRLFCYVPLHKIRYGIGSSYQKEEKEIVYAI